MRIVAVLAALTAVLVLSNGANAADRGTLAVARHAQYGPVLFDGKGYALYAFTHDQRNKSRCYGACAKAWPPYLVKNPKAGEGVKGSLIGTTRRNEPSRLSSRCSFAAQAGIGRSEVRRRPWSSTQV